MTTQVLIIGAGPGGYAAAFHAADLRLNVTLIDGEINPGGVCLYRGCIPSKALLHVAKIINDAKEAEPLGLTFQPPQIDVERVRAWKNTVISQLTGGLGILVKQRKINYIQGRARFLNSDIVEIQKSDGSREEISFESAIIATGSVPISIPFAPQSARIMDSTAALNLENIPASLLIVGGGYIGLELGTAYSALGSKVSVVEMTTSLLPGADRDLSQTFMKGLKNRFAAIRLNTKVTSIVDTGKDVAVSFLNKDNATENESFEKILIAVGRKPDMTGLGIENTKVQKDERGFVVVAPNRQTTDPKIFAIGDIAGNPMLAHKATHEGRVAAEAISGMKTIFAPKAIPAVAYTDPEVAWCGLTETEAKEKNIEVKVSKFPWAASGRAVTLNNTNGLTKIIADPKSGRVLGVGMTGTGSGEMISEAALAIEMGAVAEDLALTIHPHPTLSETIMEAAEGVFGQMTSVYRKTKF